MDEKDDKTPFPREPWQRLLADDSDGPPETTDARIRAAARRDLAPRGHRWWLPASLAASFVLAVFVVQSQLGTVRVPVFVDIDGGDGGAIDARMVEREQADAARPPGRAPSAAGERSAKAQESEETDEYGYPDPSITADSAGTGPKVGGPEREAQAASEMPEGLSATGEERSQMNLPPAPAAARAAAPATAAREKNLGEVVVTGSRRGRESVEAAPTTGMVPMAEPLSATSKIRPPPFERTPETWYAYIEKLRAQGKVEEAEFQLARLEKAHPGWVERYLRDRAGQ